MTAENERIIYTVVGWVDSYLRRIRQSGGAILDMALAQEMGARGKNWTQLVGAMRALGVINDDGRVTDLGHELTRSGDRRQQAAKNILTQCYPSLAERLAKGDVLDSETLDSHFADLSRAHRGKAISVSGRRQAAALFRFWVQESGEEDWIKTIRSRGGKKEKREPARTRRATHESPPGGRKRKSEMTAPSGFEAAITDTMPFYRATIEILPGRRLSEDQWELIKQSLAAKIDHMKSNPTVDNEKEGD